MRTGTVVYFQCNDWNPYPDAAYRFIYDYIEGPVYAEHESSVIKSRDEQDKWIKENDLCINSDIYDMSIEYWVTTTKEWLAENFPELLQFAMEEPDDEWFLKYEESNVGEFFINDLHPDEKFRCVEIKK